MQVNAKDDVQRHRRWTTVQLCDESMAPVLVLLVEAPPCSVSRDLRGLERKRRALWHNRSRNQLVAAVASALERRNLEALRSLGIDVRLDQLPRGYVGRTIAIVVEATEHAAELQLLLPGWQTLDAIPIANRREHELG